MIIDEPRQKEKKLSSREIQDKLNELQTFNKEYDFLKARVMRLRQNNFKAIEGIKLAKLKHEETLNELKKCARIEVLDDEIKALLKDLSSNLKISDNENFEIKPIII